MMKAKMMAGGGMMKKGYAAGGAMPMVERRQEGPAFALMAKARWLLVGWPKPR
jgi:hypothetical protein